MSLFAIVGSSQTDDTVDDESQIHLILIGFTGVGKTSLRKHLKDESIDDNESPTIVMEYDEIRYRTSSAGKEVSVTMWDTGGQPVFQDLLPCFARIQCIYSVVFRLPDIQELSKKPEICPCDENHERIRSPFTTRELIFHDLAYIEAFSDMTPTLGVQRFLNQEKTSTETVIVGTCKDQITSLIELLVFFLDWCATSSPQMTPSDLSGVKKWALLACKN